MRRVCLRGIRHCLYKNSLYKDLDISLRDDLYYLLWNVYSKSYTQYYQRLSNDLVWFYNRIIYTKYQWFCVCVILNRKKRHRTKSNNRVSSIMCNIDVIKKIFVDFLWTKAIEYISTTRPPSFIPPPVGNGVMINDVKDGCFNHYEQRNAQQK